MEGFSNEEAVESFLDLGNLDDVPDLGTMPDGSECELILKSIEVRDSQKTGGKFIMAIFDIVGEPNTKSINHVMMLPTEKDDEKKRNTRLRAVRTFYEAFNIPTSGQINVSDYVGNTGWGILAEEEDSQYGMQNRVRKFISG